jgi:crotonobetainyl-CoA:carnitine CoA-transferase CaiB-like acyl-CoA transferase
VSSYHKEKKSVPEQALAGLKIVDCTEGIAGTYCTKLLADFGAEVIKIERPLTGDYTRRRGPFPGDEPHMEKSGSFFYLNTNKKSVTLNLESKEGVHIFKGLVGEADALVENFQPGSMAKRGLSYAALKRINRDLIMLSISYFGQTGPYKDYAATNFTVYGLGGAMSTMRPATRPEERPVVEGGLQAEYSTGVLSYIALLGALFDRENTQKGTYIDMAAMECVASTLMGHIAEYPYMGLVRRTNPFAIHGYPIGYSAPCRDGWISLTPGIGGAPNIPLLIERPDLMEDPLFTEPRARMAAPEKFDNLIIPWLKEHDKWEIAKEAQKLRLAFTPVLSPGELAADEQIQARKFMARFEHPEMGEVTYPGAPAKLGESPWKAGRAPTLGEHNLEILGRLGYDNESLGKLKAEGII